MKYDIDQKNKIEKIKKALKTKVLGVWVADHDEFGHYYRKKGCKTRLASVTTQNTVAKPHLLHWAAKKTAEAFRDNPDLFYKYVEKEKELERLGRPKGEFNEYLMEAQRAYTEARDDAANVGTHGHNLIERYIKMWMVTGVEPDDIRKIANQAEADEYRAIAVARSAEEIFKSYKIVPLAAEILVGSYKYQMAGTLDFLCYNLETNEVELWDWKSSNSVDDDYARQAASYKFLLLDMVKDAFEIPVIRVMKLDKYSNRFKCYLVEDHKEAFKAQLANNEMYRWKTNGKLKLSMAKKVIQWNQIQTNSSNTPTS